MFLSFPSMTTVTIIASLTLPLFIAANLHAEEKTAETKAEPFTYPAPDKMEHPGAKEAPASSPLTYPDEAGHDKRAEVVLKALADGGLDKWRRGYFSGGDPGKYLTGHAMAKLLINPNDPEPVKYMNDNRSYKEHYHFAAVNWARFYPIFGDRVLTQDTKEKLDEAAFRYGAYLLGGGTENHKTMWWTTANVLPYYTETGRLNRKSKEQALKDAKQYLHTYVKKLYTAGAGEWDSSTYTQFTINGLLNIYDFSEDEESRLLAKAGLDLLMSSYATKYNDGIFNGPNQRGHYDQSHASITDQSGYIWFGSDMKVTHDDARDWRYTLHAITTAYRPNQVIYNIATRNIEGLPVTQYNRKANYWHGHHAEARMSTHETVHIAKDFTMGSLWDGHSSQHTRFQVTVATDDGAMSFTAGHPRKSDHTGKKIGIGFRDGAGRYVQSAQIGSTYIMLAKAPNDEPDDSQFVYFKYPKGAHAEKVADGWYVFSPDGVKDALLVRAIGGEVEIGKDVPGKGDKPEPNNEMMVVKGQNVGLIVEAIQIKSDAENEALLKKLKLDASGWPGKNTVSYVNKDGKNISVTFNPDPDGDRHGDRMAKVKVDGKAFNPGWEKPWGGPLMTLEDHVLTVTDGKDGFVVDFTGDLPVYKPMKK